MSIAVNPAVCYFNALLCDITVGRVYGHVIGLKSEDRLMWGVRCQTEPKSQTAKSTSYEFSVLSQAHPN